MNILIDGKDAVLKKGSSFEFIAENRFFTGADSYSLSITFPLRGCPRNVEIFGHINRKDCDLNRLLLDCEIHDKGFHRYGSVSIVEISETEVKTQFLEGRSARNYYSSLDDLYINELQLPSVIEAAHYNASHYLRNYYTQKRDEAEGGTYFGMVFLPWVNNTSGNIQNPMRYAEAANDFYYIGGGWDDVGIVGQPFLVEVIKQVLLQSGYDFDISAIEGSEWHNAIVCNALPLTWDLHDMQDILPHWTISEFLEQVELFLNGEFNINENTRKLTFAFNQITLENLQTLVIEKVIDSHQVEITAKEDVQNSYIEQKNLAYADCDHQMWKFYSCDWIKKQVASYTWTDFAQMKTRLNSFLDCAGNMTHAYYKRLHYCTREGTYFVLKCVRSAYSGGLIHHYMRIQPVNQFGQRIIDVREDAEFTELRIVPVCIDHTDNTHGDMIFIECGEYGDDIEDAEDADTNQTPVVNILADGEKDKKEEYFDKLYVGFYDGYYNKYAPYHPRADIDPVEVSPDNELLTSHYSMRLFGAEAPDSRTSAHMVDHSQKFTFTFIADAIPDVRSIFLIHGKKYLAEKITATISENGLSQQMKMVAYRLI